MSLESPPSQYIETGFHTLMNLFCLDKIRGKKWRASGTARQIKLSTTEYEL